MKCFDRSKRSLCEFPQPPDGTQACASNADCAANEYCAADKPWLCEGPGTCVSRRNCGSSSPGAWCGCNGKTYTDLQSACFDGMRAPLGGKCGVFMPPNPLLPKGGTPCGSDSQCPADQHCCAISALCLDAKHAALCVPAPPGTVRPCLDNSDCFTSYEFCDGPGCTDMGGCALLDSVKCDPSIRDLVCTCDGFTTVNEDCARSVGERIASHGVCDLPDAGLN